MIQMGLFGTLKVLIYTNFKCLEGLSKGLKQEDGVKAAGDSGSRTEGV